MGRHQLGRDLDAEQIRLVVAFLGTLTGELPDLARMP
jgi:cytochrome c peroxidase